MSEPQWHDIPKKLHPVRCATCKEVWFTRVQVDGGVNDRDFWPRFCCYCGVAFVSTSRVNPDGSIESKHTMDGRPPLPPSKE